MSIEADIAAYLDGELDEAAAAKVEAALIQPEVAQLLGEELMLRELMGSMGPDAAPEELITRLESTLGVSAGVTDRVRRQLRGASPSSGWQTLVLGAKALSAARAGVSGARVAVSGVSTVRNSLGRVADIPLLSPSKPKPLWRKAASLLWRGRK